MIKSPFKRRPLRDPADLAEAARAAILRAPHTAPPRPPELGLTIALWPGTEVPTLLSSVVVYSTTPETLADYQRDPAAFLEATMENIRMAITSGNYAVTGGLHNMPEGSGSTANERE